MATQRPLLLLFSLLLGGCFQQDKSGTSQILPFDYQATYRLARSCRPIYGHTSNNIIVRANSDEVVQQYNAANGPLPEGSVILAEEYSKADCTGLTGYTLMFKDKPGYNPAAADWHWQRLDDLHVVLEDGRVQGCIDCHTLCQRNDYTCSPP
jgi:hypothetical protein